MRDRLRLTELLAALSVATDLGTGQPPEKAVRSCLLATGLARALDLPDRQVRDVYLASLLRHLGCTATAAVEARQVRGGTEQYYQRTARRMVVAEPQAAGTAAMLAAVAQELDRSPIEPHLTLRHLRLSPAQARKLGETLTSLVDDAEEAAEDQPVHGVLVALYQQAVPGGTTDPA
ncbi:ArsR family transcriptional regulator [Streptomyces sp. CC208A]|uniref:ArsR family transcriptional regulator n=1 Tax=Streptomyces sp. CC208A TaxID=3044573 RepID=UPI0024A865D4|nr:ArsR family transcriptional regulator [Streptomyces sp. CC208A]